MKPLYGVKRKQANQPNHRVDCQNAPTCFFQKETHTVEWRLHEFIYSAPGGALQYSQPLNQRCLSCAGQNNTTRYFRGESVGAGIGFEAETRNCSLADHRSGSSPCLCSELPGPQAVLEVPPTTFSLLPRLFSPFPFSHGSHVCRPSIAFPQLASHPGPHPLSRGDFHGWGSPQHSSTSASKTRAPLLGSLPYRTAVSVLRAVWRIQVDFCICQFYGAEGCSSGFF